MPEPAFSKVMQIGIVVRDLDAAVRAWEERYGIGPWSVFELGPGDSENVRVHGQQSCALFTNATPMAPARSARAPRRAPVTRPKAARPRVLPGGARGIRWDRVSRVALLVVLLGMLFLYIGPARSYWSTACRPCRRSLIRPCWHCHRRQTG